jgi:hypothetical protein
VIRVSTVILFLVFPFIQSFSQQWASLGANWHYTEKDAFSPVIDYFKITAVSTQIIKGKLCTEMIRNEYPLCSGFSGSAFTYEENDTVYWYNPDLDTLQFLYDFTANVGDSWNMLFLDPSASPDLDTLEVTVDSLDTININGFNLKRWFVTYDFKAEVFPFSYTGIIVENIGDLYYMFNFPGEDIIACDANYPDYIRCYEDTVIGFQAFNGYDSTTCEQILTNVPEQQKVVELLVYPNPFQNSTTVEFKLESKAERLTVTNIFGDVVQSIELYSKDVKAELDLSECPSGVYFCMVQIGSKSISTKKIILTK